MDFNEKLQYLRKQKNMTQEQLAEKLFVSRTAVSKWESGKGYPNIESLRCIANMFEITIDDLLSGDELIAVAEKENQNNLKRIYNAIFGFLDVAAILLVFLPLYWNPKGGYSVNLFLFSDVLSGVSLIYWLFFIILTLMGAFELLFFHKFKEQWGNVFEKISLSISMVATLFFGAVKEPYVVAFMFLFFLGKLFLWMKKKAIK